MKLVAAKTMLLDPAMNTPHTPVISRAPRILLLAALALAPFYLRAQPTPNPPGQVSFQGFLTDANGLPLATNTPRNYDVNFRIYTAPNNGTAIWGEVQTVVVDRGYFSVLLGQGAALASGEPFTNNLSSFFVGANASDRYVGITVKGVSTPDSEIQPRLRLLAQPYAFLAANANALVNNAGQQLISGASGNPIFNMTNATLNGAPTFANGFTVVNGAFESGNPNFNGNPTFSGNPVFSGNPTFSGSPSFSGSLTFAGTVNFLTNEFLNNFDLYLGSSDANGLGYYDATKTFNGFGPYGPVLYGYDGGGLGCKYPFELALSWDWHDNVVIDPQNLNNGFLNNGATTGAGLTFGSTSGEGIFSKRTAGGNQYSLNLCTAFAPRVTILQNGLVGVGTTAPAYQLDVGGGNIHSYSMYTDGFFYSKWNGAYLALYWNSGNNSAYWSDRRLKQDVQTIPNAVKTIQQLRGVSYHWNEDGLKHLTRDIEEKWRSVSGTPEDNQKLWAEKRAERTAELAKTQTGFVAQEVEQVFPDWVKTDPTSGYRQIDTQHLDAVMVNAIKEQQDQIDAQQRRISELQVANAALERRLQALEKALKSGGTTPAEVVK